MRCYVSEPVQQGKKKKVKGPKPASKRVTVKDVIRGETTVNEPDKLVAMLHARDRKTRAQFTQQLTDWGVCLRPYIQDYFSDINNLLFETPIFLQEKFIMIAFLGLRTPSQLEDPEVICEQVKIHLKKGKLTHAVHLCRMARENGSSGMGEIAQYLENHVDHEFALKILNNMKRWKCIPDERTSEFLSKPITRPDLGLKNPKHESLLQIYDRSMDRAKSAKDKLILTNSVLEILARNSTLADTFEMYYLIPNRGAFSRDYKTYSIMLNLIASKELSTKGLQRMRTMIWSDIQNRKDLGEIAVDSDLVDSYCRSLQREPNPKYYTWLMETIDQYYSKNLDLDRFSNKFPLTSRQLDIILTSTLNTQSPESAFLTYETIAEYKHVELSLENYHNFLRNFLLHHSDHKTLADSVWSSIMDRYKAGNTALKPTSLTFHLVLLNYMKHPAREIYQDSIEEMLQTLIDLKVPIDDLILSNYIRVYTRWYASSMGQAPARDVGIQALKFASQNLSAISEVSGLQKHPKLIRNSLLKLEDLCKYVKNHPDHAGYKKSSELAWVDQLQNKAVRLYSTLEDNHMGAKDPVQTAGMRRVLSEKDRYHERQKEISKRYRRRIVYHEVKINKPTTKALAEKLRLLMHRNLVDPPTVGHTFSKVEIP